MKFQVLGTFGERQTDLTCGRTFSDFVVTWFQSFKPKDLTKELSEMTLSQVTCNHASLLK